MKRFLATLMFVLLACDNPLPSAPDPDPLPPPLEDPDRPPRVDEPFDLSGGVNGVIAFGLGHPGQSEEDVLAFVNAVMAGGWNTIQPCSETEFWDNTYQYPRKPRDLARLQWLLEILARVPGIQVTLVGNCTLKRQVPLEEQREWATLVAKLVAGGKALDTKFGRIEASERYANVAVYTHNELQNCEGRSDWGGRAEWCADKQEARWHVEMFRSYGIQATLDDGVCQGPDRDSTYQFRFRNIGAAPASFHPCRTDQRGRPWDPDRRFLRRMAEVNGPFILSETVAWADSSGNCGGLRTCDPLRLERYIGDCAAVPECSFTLHCENCLNGEVPTLIPRAR